MHFPRPPQKGSERKVQGRVHFGDFLRQLAGTYVLSDDVNEATIIMTLFGVGEAAGVAQATYLRAVAIHCPKRASAEVC
jgi:hypothetical protein